MWNLVISFVMLAVSYAIQPKPPKPKPAALSEFDVPTAEENRPIPVVFGTKRVRGPNVLWYGDLSSAPIRRSSK
jgi:hypothetical protein